MECLEPDGTLYVRNQRPEDLKIRFELGRPDTLVVRAGTTEGFSSFACDSTAIVALDASGQKELARLGGPICRIVTWTFTPDGASLADGAPPAG
jgi:hypothetical protein